MREIKFRAVTREGKIIKDVGCIKFFEDGSIIVNGEIPVEKLIQYVGLKDKNGKEIYEGDIIQFQLDVLDDGSFGNSLKPRYFTLAKVIFMAGAFRFECDGNAPLAHSACEIIGNIYEDSHLIDNK